jgi:hypothetical protein
MNDDLLSTARKCFPEHLRLSSSHGRCPPSLKAEEVSGLVTAKKKILVMAFSYCKLRAVPKYVSNKHTEIVQLIFVLIS